MEQTAEMFRALGDESRLRILRLLLEEPLNVGELTSILGLAQPTVSKHLGELKKIDLVTSNRKGGYSYYQVSDQIDEDWPALRTTLANLRSGRGDLARLEEVLQNRKEFSQADRFVVPGRSWIAWSRAISYLLPSVRVADFGCGDGAFTVEMARWASEVIAIDSNQAYLDLARSTASGYSNVRFLNERMESTSVSDAAVDLVVISQSLHYTEVPQRVLSEAHRILKSHGRVLIIELLPHNEDWVGPELGHLWNGIEPRNLAVWMEEAGFRDVNIDMEFRRNSDTFQPFITTGVKS